MSKSLPAAMLLDAMAEPALLIQSDGVVLHANDPLGRRLKLAQARIDGQQLGNFLLSPWEDAATYLHRVSGSRQSTVGAIILRRADGTAFNCRCHGNLVEPARDGAPATLLVRCQERSQDTSPFLQLNRRLQELTKENANRQNTETQLQDLNQELEVRVRQEIAARELAQERLAQAQRLEALGQLAAGIAHDFNNVLQAISGGLAMIQKRAKDSAAVVEFSRMVMDAADRGATITGRLLSFARQGELRAAANDVGQLLTGVREMLTPVLGVTIVLRVEFPDPSPWLYADRGQLDTALVNLVINARDAMPNGGNVLIRATSEVVVDPFTHPGVLASGRYVRVEIIDTGGGMDAATLARASEPFFTTKPVGQGTGLGLAMARGFTRQSNGGFGITSARGKGTTVTLWFPEVTGTLVEANVPTNEKSGASTAQSARVLVVDDDALVRAVIISQLEDQGYQTIQASDGLAALAWLEKGGTVDLMVTDFAMPGMNGLTLIKEVRRRGSALPAVLLTGYADTTIERAVQESNTVLLRKPVRSDELIERTEALLRNRSA
jgi:signal transduction histidine kinase/ActR/RegA family two-component response regulator